MPPLLLLFAGVAHGASWYLVVRRDGPGAALVRASSMRQILRGRWEGGGKPAFGVLRGDAGTEEFRSLTGQSMNQYFDAWSIRLFAGRDVPPRYFSSVADSLEFVSGAKNGLVLLFADPERQQALDWVPLGDLKRE